MLAFVTADREFLGRRYENIHTKVVTQVGVGEWLLALLNRHNLEQPLLS